MDKDIHRKTPHRVGPPFTRPSLCPLKRTLLVLPYQFIPTFKSYKIKADISRPTLGHNALGSIEVELSKCNQTGIDYGRLCLPIFVLSLKTI